MLILIFPSELKFLYVNVRLAPPPPPSMYVSEARNKDVIEVILDKWMMKY